MHEDGLALERARELVGRRRADARALELDALAAVEVAHAGHHDPRRVDDGASPRPASQRPHAAARHMPPRKPLGVVSGVLKSPCASSQTTRASGSWRSTVGSVVMQIEQSEASRTGNSAGGQRVVDLAAGLEQAAARVAQVVLEAAGRASPGEPIIRGSTPSSRASRGASASAPRAPPGVRSDVRQSSATTDALTGPSTPARASRRTP